VDFPSLQIPLRNKFIFKAAIMRQEWKLVEKMVQPVKPKTEVSATKDTNGFVPKILETDKFL
jgi:hypothetical protein